MFGGSRLLRKDIQKTEPPLAGTADIREIARFNALAEEWWDPHGAFKVIHKFNAARVEYLSQRLPVLLQCTTTEAPLRGKKILDVGCAAGLVTEPLSGLGADVLGIDAAERNILVARHHAAATGARVQYRHALPEDLSDQAGSFDVVMSLEVVEHVANLPNFLRALSLLVAPAGLLVIGTLNRTIPAFVKAIIGAEYVLRWLPRGTHNWKKFVTPKELDRGLRGYGFKVEERAGVVLNPLSMRWNISDDCSVTYLQIHLRS
jgi:2-polyprenyl-6-hydroxyphenyl methylase / 3-demethylubiquinone-9 3-methyltransferase